MKHPLENLSLTPIGFVFPNQKKRIEEKLGQYMVNGDYYAALFWNNANKVYENTNQPAKVILQEILPYLSGYKHEAEDFMFDGLQYISRDIMVLSACMQWTGTNNGRSFMTESPFGYDWNGFDEFVCKYTHENKNDELSRVLLHQCTEDCEDVAPGIEACVYDGEQITSRDRLVIDSLMIWLGTDQGRMYMKEYDAYFKSEYAKSQTGYLRAV
jgi:hypothetical protein